MESTQHSGTQPLTLVFTDMVGSSAAKRALSLGDDASTRDEAYLDAVQTRHLRVVRECVSAHDGKEIMTIGDAFFLTFEKAENALLCCAEIQMRLKAQPIMTPSGPMRLRIGMHCGWPKFFENSWHGTDVDTAARVEAVGSPEQIVLTEAVREQLGEMPGVKLRPLGTFALKGVGDVVLWDADYDAHGPREPQVLSSERIRRQTRLAWLSRAGVVLFCILVFLGAFLYYQREQRNKIKAKDKLILADFDNQTGDPVFDATLKEALSIQLEQSPYLQLVGDQELHADLRYLNQPSDQRITPALAREIGQREGIKAYITASVANLGSSYVVSVDAINCATGDPIARAQAQAADKNHVLTAISTAASALRSKLGESLASVQKLSTPFLDVTTSSLEAFHAYSLGEDAHRKGADPEALVFYKQAVELDPNFAMAWTRQGVIYNNFGQLANAVEVLTKAYNLREKATERERLYITAQLFSARGDLPRMIGAYQALLAAYPDDPAGLNNLGIAYGNGGQEDKAVTFYQRVIETAPWDIAVSDNLAGTLLQLGRPAEAKKYMEASAASGSGTDTNLLADQGLYAFEMGDPSWKQLAYTDDTRPDGFLVAQVLSDLYSMNGATGDAERSARRGMEEAVKANAHDAAGNTGATAALMEAEYGQCEQATVLARQALSYDASIQTLPGAATALAMCGNGVDALANLRKLAAAQADNTLLHEVYLPETEAAVALQQRHYDQVLRLLERTRPYAIASVAPILEAEALLALRRPADALHVLEPALRYRYNEIQMGPAGQIPSYAMGTLLAARAHAMAGDKGAAVTSYRQVIDLWKDADPGFKPLLDARKELAALQGSGTLR